MAAMANYPLAWGAIQSFAQMHREVHNWQSAAEEWTVRALESIGAIRSGETECPFPFVLRHSKHDSLP